MLALAGEFVLLQIEQALQVLDLRVLLPEASDIILNLLSLVLLLLRVLVSDARKQLVELLLLLLELNPVVLHQHV